MARRQDGFLLTCVVGLAFLVPGIFTYSYYTEIPSPWVAVMCCSLMLMGFATIYAAARQFRTGASPIGTGLQASLWAAALTALPIAIGLDGLGFLSLNLTAATMLFATALEYWRARDEARGPLIGMAALYAMTGMSFLLCAAMIGFQQHWILGRAPDNWAENLNIAISIAGMTGIGAMSLMVHQARLTEHHRRESLTDALTGLPNRRALFEAYQTLPFNEETAVIIFDIDRFKQVNDHYGHAAGDEVIRVLAEELRQSVGLTLAARLGGEEFAAVLRTAAPGYAEWLSERIRRNFADREILVDGEVLRVTVSAGVAYGHDSCADFDGVLRRADTALYLAKRNGRNRVELASACQPDKAQRSTA